MLTEYQTRCFHVDGISFMFSLVIHVLYISIQCLNFKEIYLKIIVSKDLKCLDVHNEKFERVAEIF